MKITPFIILISLFFLSCTKEPKITLKELPNTRVQMNSFDALPNFNDENFDKVLVLFQKNCQSKKAYKIYQELCTEAKNVTDSKKFIIDNFQVYRVLNNKEENRGLLTGYYEAEIHASYTKDSRYKYPIYASPNDLITVDLSSIYPKLKNYRLRGKVQGNRLIPYYTRKEASSRDLNASVLCYCDSKIDKFFLEVQGSGIASMDDNTSIYLGYANQNGHKYSSIGRYLIEKNELQRDEVSLQSITKWLRMHPNRVDEVLNHNKSMVFFSKRKQGATGSLGVKLTPMRSIAVDKRYIPLGSMLYLSANLNSSKKIDKIVFAQDTGGAIKGSVRADLFVGSGLEALEFAGGLKAPLKLWLILPKKRVKE